MAEDFVLMESLHAHHFIFNVFPNIVTREWFAVEIVLPGAISSTVFVNVYRMRNLLLGSA